MKQAQWTEAKWMIELEIAIVELYAGMVYMEWLKRSWFKIEGMTNTHDSYD